MSLQISGTVTRRSNGSIDIAPTGDAAASRIVLHESALGSKALPAMGDEVTVTIDVTAPIAQAEAAPAVVSSDDAATSRKKK